MKMHRAVKQQPSKASLPILHFAATNRKLILQLAIFSCRATTSQNSFDLWFSPFKKYERQNLSDANLTDVDKQNQPICPL